MLGLLLRRLRDPRTRSLLAALITAGGDVYRTPLAVGVLGLDADPLAPGKGLPIGSLLSQWSANLYLDGLDHWSVAASRPSRMTSFARWAWR